MQWPQDLGHLPPMLMHEKMRYLLEGVQCEGARLAGRA